MGNSNVAYCPEPDCDVIQQGYTVCKDSNCSDREKGEHGHCKRERCRGILIPPQG
jgi:hypothetical protein